MSKINSNSNLIQLEKKLNILKDFNPTKYEHWKAKVIKDINGADFNAELKTFTYEGIELQPIYVKNDLNEIPFINEFPGFASYLRGTKSTGCGNDCWEIAQTINTDDPDKYNSLLKTGLMNGQTSIILNESENHFCNSLLNFANNFLQNIDLSKYPINIFCGYSSKDFLSEFEKYLELKKISFSDIKGGIFSSPIACFFKNGYMPNQVEQVFDELNIVTNSLYQKNSKLRSILIDASIYNNAGSSAVQDLAFSLASGSEYVYRLASMGTEVNQIASQISFKFGIGSFYFMEIAKLRAAKVLWSKILEEYGVDAEHRKMHIIAQTTMYNQTTHEIHNNILRGTTEAFSAIIGGIDVLDVTPFDKHRSEANEFSLHLARNIQNILKEESHLDKIIDASGGSYYIEKLTEELCYKAWELLQNVEEKGGMIETLKSNFIQDSIAKVNKKKLKDFTQEKTILVGVNKYLNQKETITSEKKKTSKIKPDSSLEGLHNSTKIKPIVQVRAAEQFEKQRSDF